MYCIFTTGDHRSELSLKSLLGFALKGIDWPGSTLHSCKACSALCPAVTKVSNKGDNLLLLQGFSGRVMQHDHCVILYNVTVSIKKYYPIYISAEYLFGHSYLLQSSRGIFYHLLYLYQSSTQLSLCWACDWRGWQAGLYLARHKSASFGALIAVVTGNHLWVITKDAELFFTVNSWIVVSPSGILREPNWRSMGQGFSILLYCSSGENIEEEQMRKKGRWGGALWAYSMNELMHQGQKLLLRIHLWTKQ